MIQGWDEYSCFLRQYTLFEIKVIRSKGFLMKFFLRGMITINGAGVIHPNTVLQPAIGNGRKDHPSIHSSDLIITARIIIRSYILIIEFFSMNTNLDNIIILLSLKNGTIIGTLVEGGV
jgi:hypothetical protein